LPRLPTIVGTVRKQDQEAAANPATEASAV
jgi:hypothetical protein